VKQREVSAPVMYAHEIKAHTIRADMIYVNELKTR